MAFCNAFQVALPDSFPLAEWNTLLAYGVLCTTTNNEAGGEFVRAMGAAAYRYRAADEVLSSMISDWHASGKALDFEAQYRQQRDLFAFFSCTVSVIESALYASYIVLTQRHLAAVPWSDVAARRGYFDKSLSTHLARASPSGHPLAPVVTALDSAPEWSEAKGFRNSLLHRALPSRLVEGVAGAGTPPALIMVKYAKSWIDPELRATEPQMQQRLLWVADQLKLICIHASAL